MATDGKKKNSMLDIQNWQYVRALLIVYDITAIAFAYFFALWIRFDGKISEIPKDYADYAILTLPFYAVFCIIIYWTFHLYTSIWRFASYRELIRLIGALVIQFTLHLVIVNNFVHRMPTSYYIIGIYTQGMLIIGVRFAYRFVVLLRARSEVRNMPLVNVMIVGAGQAGQLLERDIKYAKEIHEKVCCFIDDDPNKHGRSIDTITVVGGRDSIIENCAKYGIEKIYVAMPSAPRTEIKEILRLCNQTECEVLSLPGVYQLALGEVTVSKMKKVEVEDLLGREPIEADVEKVFENLKDKTILVTGGGGSIGSELCRQIAAHTPKKLVIFDVYENSTYDIQLELKKNYPDLDLEVIIGSVRDSRKIFDVFETYRPQMVYHAAAHKHVPLMEDSPCESIKNNTLGTYKTAFAAMANGCERFVLISTDKAVNPTNIMGASKRLCEMICQAFDSKIKEGKACDLPQLFTHGVMQDFVTKPEVMEAIKNTKTEFVAVRFGNVLGSNGSVIPLFKKQIAEGGPVTVTHPDIIRYFMTIPEAVRLVLLAGTYAKGGEIFVLDMGEPVKIVDLARTIIKLSGYKPDVDIKIKFTGLRPGEKLFEEKLMAEEGLRRTPSELIHIGCPIPFEVDEFLKQLEELLFVAYRNRAEETREMVKTIVTNYKPEVIK